MTYTSCSPPGGKHGHYLGQDHLTCGSCLSLTISYICSNEIPEQNVCLIYCHILKHSYSVYQHTHNFFTLTFRALGRNKKLRFRHRNSICSLAVRFFVVVPTYESDIVNVSFKIAYKNVCVSEIDLITREKSIFSFYT